MGCYKKFAFFLKKTFYIVSQESSSSVKIIGLQGAEAKYGLIFKTFLFRLICVSLEKKRLHKSKFQLLALLF